MILKLPVSKGKKIWLELECIEDGDMIESSIIGKFYTADQVDIFRPTRIILNETHFNNELKSKIKGLIEEL